MFNIKILASLSMMFMSGLVTAQTGRSIPFDTFNWSTTGEVNELRLNQSYATNCSGTSGRYSVIELNNPFGTNRMIRTQVTVNPTYWPVSDWMMAALQLRLSDGRVAQVRRLQSPDGQDQYQFMVLDHGQVIGLESFPARGLGYATLTLSIDQSRVYGAVNDGNSQRPLGNVYLGQNNLLVRPGLMCETSYAGPSIDFSNFIVGY